MKKFTLYFCLVFLYFNAESQSLGVSDIGNPPHQSAGLDVNFSDKGILIPRISLTSITDITTISNPETGLLVFNINPSMTDGGIGFWYYNANYSKGAQWIRLAESEGQCVSGPNLSITATDLQICIGGSVTLTASGATGYMWDNGLGSGSSHTVSPTTTTTYEVTGTNSGNCTSTKTVTIVVNSVPTVSLSASPTTINSGQSATLTAGGANSYSWSHGLGSGNSKTVSPTSTTTYTVTGTTNGCSDTKIITITVNSGIQVGDLHAGGIVFKVSGSPGNQHGLVASLSEQSYGMKWGHYGTVTGANSSFNGVTNTSTIVSLGGTSAAITAANHNGGGYSDWYLPSKSELTSLYNNVTAVNNGLNANGYYSNIALEAYWSSTEASGSNASNWAWVVQFANGASGENLKNSPALRRVRAIRAF